MTSIFNGTATCLVLMLLQVSRAVAPNLSDYTPNGAQKPLERGEALDLRSMRVYDEAHFGAESWILPAGKSGKLTGMKDDFYHISISPDTTFWVYRTELALLPSQSEEAKVEQGGRDKLLPELVTRQQAQVGDTLNLHSPLLYDKADLLSSTAIQPGSRNWIVVQPENQLGFLQVNQDSLGTGWIYRSEIPTAQRRPVADIGVSQP